MTRVLFICSQNRMRSPTAEQVFARHPGIACASAGLNHGADNPLTAELVEWAELIFVMEQHHKTILSARFSSHLRGKRIVCLDIPDNYAYMDPPLIALLEARVGPLLPR
jgi:predicted protein tyrosine phosphatase